MRTRYSARLVVILGIGAWCLGVLTAQASEVQVADGPATAGITFVTVTIHGQVAAAFSADDPSAIVPQAWVHDMQVSLDSMADQINAARSGASLLPIERVGVEGDWARLTWYGARYILGSRLLALIGPEIPAFPDPSIGPLTLETADLMLSLGQAQSSNMSRFAARRIVGEAFGAVDQRLTDHPDIPVFVDVVGHSRGGAVSAEFIRLLTAAEQRLAPGAPRPVLSVTYLDGIDPTPGGLATLAGNLINDPVIARAGNERISNFHAEHGFDPVKDSTSFFGPGLIEWLELVGASTADEDLVEQGYPRGRSRPELFPNPSPFTDIDELMAGETHLTVESLYTSMADVAVGQAPVSNFSFSATTALGEVIQDPLLSIPRTPDQNGAAAWSTDELIYADPPAPAGERAGSVAPGEAIAQVAGELVRDSAFIDSAALVENAGVLLDSPVFLFILPDSVGGIETLLGQIDAAQFPFLGVWEQSGPGVTIVNPADVAQARLIDGDVLSQDLAVGSMDYGRFLIEVEMEFLQATGDLTVSLAGDRLMVFESALASQVGTGSRHTVRFLARRRFEPPGPVVLDSVNLLGSDAAIYSVSVVPRPLDLDVVSYILARSVDPPDDWDANGDGAVDVADAIRAAKYGI